jgi:H+-translocating NAD(P) transhydrogenase subunit alpha
MLPRTWGRGAGAALVVALTLGLTAPHAPAAAEPSAAPYQAAPSTAAPLAALSAVQEPMPMPMSAQAEAPAPGEEAPDYWSLLFVFVLSSFIGLGVIRRVSRLLHTPLMSITNAISAIAVVGSILVTGEDYPQPIRIMGAIALFASVTNIVSGFLITDRMLKMFKTTDKAHS